MGSVVSVLAAGVFIAAGVWLVWRYSQPAAFPAWVAAAFVAVYINVVSGAFVRVTNSGLGCPDWPACHGRAVPPMNWNSIAEFTNRVMAFLVVMTTIGLAVCAARGVRRADRARWWMAFAVAAGTVAEAPLGAVTIVTGLNPYVVMTHFLLAIIVFSVATVLFIDVWGAPAAGASRPAWLPVAVAVFTLWSLLMITSGAVVTMAGTHPGASNVPRIWNLLDAAYWHVRVAVSFVVVLAGFLFACSRLAVTGYRVPRLAWLVVVLTASQILIGEWQWRHQLPWWAVLAHVATATALWSAVIALGRSLVPRPVTT